MHLTPTMTLFTPAQAERITGVSVVQQRNLRRHGYLPGNDGHARFDLFDLAEMLVINLLSSRGIGPGQAKEIAPICALGIAWAVLGVVDAYEGDHLRAFEDVIPHRPLSEQDRETIAAAAQSAGVEFPTDLDGNWHARGDSLRRTVFTHRKKGRVIPAPLFIWWADGSHVFHRSLDEALLDGSSSDPRWSGPIVVLALRALGDVLIDRAACAFVHIELDALADREVHL